MPNQRVPMHALDGTRCSLSSGRTADRWAVPSIARRAGFYRKDRRGFCPRSSETKGVDSTRITLRIAATCSAGRRRSVPAESSGSAGRTYANSNPTQQLLHHDDRVQMAGVLHVRALDGQTNFRDVLERRVVLGGQTPARFPIGGLAQTRSSMTSRRRFSTDGASGRRTGTSSFRFSSK